VSSLRIDRETRSGGFHVEDCAFAPDGKQLITSSRDNMVRIWDIDESSVKKEIDLGEQYEGPNLAVSGDGRMLVVTGLNSRATLWNLETGAKLQSYYVDGDMNTRNFARLSGGDNPVLVLLSVNQHKRSVVTFFDAGSGKALSSLEIRSNNVGGLTISPNGLHAMVLEVGEKANVYHFLTLTKEGGRSTKPLDIPSLRSIKAVSADGAYLLVTTDSGERSALQLWGMPKK
jgi:WD40 repeat protein